MHTIMVCSLQGGVGKSTAAMHIGACLARYEEQRVLLIDLDPGAILSSRFGLAPDSRSTVAALLQGVHSLEGVAQKTSVPNLSIVPASLDLLNIESTAALTEDVDSRDRLRNALQGADFDVCLIDTPPSLGWLTQAAFRAADHSIICVNPELHAAHSMHPLERLYEYHEIERQNHPLEVLGVMMSFWDEGGATNSALLQVIEEAFPGKLFESKIRRDIAVSRAVLEGRSVAVTDSQSRVVHDFRALSREVACRCGLEAGELVEV